MRVNYNTSPSSGQAEDPRGGVGFPIVIVGILSHSGELYESQYRPIYGELSSPFRMSFSLKTTQARRNK